MGIIPSVPYLYDTSVTVAVSGTAADFTTQTPANNRRDAVNVMNSMTAARLAIGVNNTPTTSAYQYVLMPGESLDIEADWSQRISLLALDSGSGNAIVTEMRWRAQNQH